MIMKEINKARLKPYLEQTTLGGDKK